MKTLLLLLFSFALAARAQPTFPTNVIVRPKAPGPALLVWDANVETNVVGYTVFIGVASGIYNTNWSATTTNASLAGLGTGTFYAVVTASDDAGRESDPSEEIRFDLPLVRPRPAKPVQIKTAELRVTIRYADSLDGPWHVATNFPDMLFIADHPRRFYRLADLAIEHGPPISNGR